MKFSKKTVLATMATQATALVQMEVRYSDRMVDVGNLDLFDVTWQAIYGEAGNTRAIMTDRSFSSQTNTCTWAEDYDPDLTVQVKMNGAWGRTPALSDNQMRDGLVQSMWEVLRTVSDPYGYENSPGLAQCENQTWGHKVPSTLRVTAYIDGRLQPDDLIIEFGATKNQEPGGCGLVGEVAGFLAGFIPVGGDLFAKGIEIGCAE
ncbi:hypothetical protein CKAH01_09611 [Colletotrichum kahawae]|uniref:Uncharacterized protein n=1 Tax=Colletotrichum kahawae TaxID=34407 RepID=A0AAE0CYU1_COLKA|nr:hypothetical protein CKAH01_09611 [Colletotrichum kahawae]